MMIFGELYQLIFADGMSYIGASIHGAKRRYNEHQYEVRMGSTRLMHKAWRELGPPILVILKRNVPETLLWLAEKKAIIKYGTKTPGGYNGQNGCESAPSQLGKVHSEEAKARRSRANSGSNHPMFGKKHSEESKDKNRLSHLGRKHTDETKEKCRLLSLRWRALQRAGMWVKRGSTL